MKEGVLEEPEPPPYRRRRVDPEPRVFSHSRESIAAALAPFSFGRWTLDLGLWTAGSDEGHATGAAEFRRRRNRESALAVAAEARATMAKSS